MRDRKYVIALANDGLNSHFPTVLLTNTSTIRRPFNLERPLALWNLALAVVSAVGAFRVGAHLLYLLSPFGGYSFRDSICECVA